MKFETFLTKNEENLKEIRETYIKELLTESKRNYRNISQFFIEAYQQT